MTETLNAPPTVQDEPVADLVARALPHVEVVEGQVRSAQCRELLATVGAARERLQSTSCGAVLVIAGEPCVGKSRLLNSLLGRPGLLPVDPDVSTGVHVMIGHAVGAECVLVSFADRAEPTRVEIDRLVDYVSVGENPGNTKGVVGVEVHVDCPLLSGGLRIVDTPGVGGLDAAHGRFTLAALAKADALLMVVGAGRPMSSAELEFLTSAVGRRCVVRIVMTKIDNHPGWRDVLAEDLELVRRYAPQLADVEILPVSARLAECALPAGPGESRRVREESRLDDLDRWIQEGVVGRLRGERFRDSVGQVVEAAEALRSRMDAFLAEAGDGNEPLDPATQRARLDELKRTANQWRPRFAGALATADNQASNEIAKQSVAIRRRIEVQIEKEWHDTMRERIPNELQLDLTAVKLEIESMLVEQLRAAFEMAADEMAIPRVEMPQLEFSAATPIAGVIAPGRAVGAQDAGRALRQVLMSGVSVFSTGPFGLMRLAIGLGGALIDIRAGKLARDRQEVRNWVADAVAAWSREVTAAERDGMREARLRIEEILTCAIAERVAHEEARLAEVSARAAGDAPQRAQVAVIESARRRLEEARLALEELRSTTDPEVAS